jgi:hypothetical protein
MSPLSNFVKELIKCYDFEIGEELVVNFCAGPLVTFEPRFEEGPDDTKLFLGVL